jgi:hypothetical protein
MEYLLTGKLESFFANIDPASDTGAGKRKP